MQSVSGPRIAIFPWIKMYKLYIKMQSIKRRSCRYREIENHSSRLAAVAKLRERFKNGMGKMTIYPTRFFIFCFFFLNLSPQSRQEGCPLRACLKEGLGQALDRPWMGTKPGRAPGLAALRATPLTIFLQKLT